MRTSYRSKVILLLMLALLFSCATPKVIVLSRNSMGGVIGYQNYDPQSDDGALINEKINCPYGHRMTLNRANSQVTGAPAYIVNNNMILPLNDGVIRWMEYHYQCIEKELIETRIENNSPIETNSQPQPEQEKDCPTRCKELHKANELQKGMTINSCIKKLCK